MDGGEARKIAVDRSGQQGSAREIPGLVKASICWHLATISFHLKSN
jgi:hypothetical protein